MIQLLESITSETDEKILITEAASGNEAAFSKIYRRHHMQAYYGALKFLHDHHESQDIVQQTFLRVHRAIGRFRGDSSLKTWIYKISMNLAMNQFWHGERRRRSSTMSLDEDVEGGSNLHDLLRDESESAEARFRTSELSLDIDRAMEGLSPEHRKILHLRGNLEMEYEEIATRLQIGLGTVKSRIARAREILRTRLDPSHR